MSDGEHRVLTSIIHSTHVVIYSLTCFWTQGKQTWGCLDLLCFTVNSPKNFLQTSRNAPVCRKTGHINHLLWQIYASQEIFTAINAERSWPLDRKCQRSTQKASAGDSVSSNLSSARKNLVCKTQPTSDLRTLRPQWHHRTLHHTADGSAVWMTLCSENGISVTLSGEFIGHVYSVRAKSEF